MILRFLPRSVFAILITVLYGLLLAFIMSHHELWRDEAQAWLISAASNSLMDILNNTRYEGHPPLWFIVMWPFTYFDNPNWIKVPHFLLSIAVCFLVVRYAPFPRYVTVMLVFSYFFFYEYAVISRNYQLGVLGMVGFLATLPKAKDNPWWAVLFLSIAATANVFALIISLLLGFYYLVQVFPKLLSGSQAQQFRLRLVLPVLVLLGIVVATAIKMNPPADQDFSPAWFWTFQFDRANAIWHMFGQVLVPIPSDVVQFWNHSILPGPWLKYTTGILIIALFLGFYRQPKYLFWLGFFLVALILFQHIKFIGNIRHGGHMWLAVVIVVWLLAAQIGWRQLPTMLKGLFVVLLVGHMYATISASAKEVAYEFSGGEATAQFVKQAGYAEHDIIAFPDHTVSSFLAHMAKPAYFPINHQMGTFVWWNNKRANHNFPEYLHQEEIALRQKAGKTIIVTSRELYNEFDWLHLVFDSGKAITDESIRIYTIAPLP